MAESKGVAESKARQEMIEFIAAQILEKKFHDEFLQSQKIKDELDQRMRELSDLQDSLKKTRKAKESYEGEESSKRNLKVNMRASDNLTEAESDELLQLTGKSSFARAVVARHAGTEASQWAARAAESQENIEELEGKIKKKTAELESFKKSHGGLDQINDVKRSQDAYNYALTMCLSYKAGISPREKIRATGREYNTEFEEIVTNLQLNIQLVKQYQEVIQGLANYIARIEKDYAKTQNYQSGFSVWKESQGLNRKINYVLARQLQEQMNNCIRTGNYEELSQLFRPENINARRINIIREVLKIPKKDRSYYESSGVRSPELKTIFDAEKKIAKKITPTVAPDVGIPPARRPLVPGKTI